MRSASTPARKKQIRPVTIATYQVITTRRGGHTSAPRAARRPRLGLDHLRRGAPAAGAGLPDDRRPAGPPSARPDRHAGARGRPGRRRVLTDRARSATTRRGRTSRRRATSRPPTASRSGSPSTKPSGWRTRLPSPDQKYRLASTAESKTGVVVDLVAKHRGTPTLVIGQYVDQLEELAARLDAPLITGETTVRRREQLYSRPSAPVRSNCSW